MTDSTTELQAAISSLPGFGWGGRGVAWTPLTEGYFRAAGRGELVVQRCANCGTEHYPRTDPAVIMAVTDRDDRLLLARNASWPPNRASVLAGFVEPGETLEAAVARECEEEAGLKITSVRYLGSQPWPLPRSLMLGFTTTVEDPTLHLDGVELDWGKWYSRAELKEAVSSGELLLLPADISIARRLINHWYGGDPVAG